VTYDEAVYTVTLEPMYDPDTGEMYVVTKVMDSGGVFVETNDSRTDPMPTVTFNNVYEAAPGTSTPEFGLTVVGRDWLPGETFSFGISGATSGTPLPATTTVDLTSPAAAAAFGFGDITFTAPGTYTYAIQQIPPATPLGGMTYDPYIEYMTVTVTDDGSGVLQTAITYEGNQSFVNYYETMLEVPLAVTTSLTGRDSVNGEFWYEIMPADAASAGIFGVPLVGLTWSNSAAANGAVESMNPLGPLHFTQDNAGGTYCATITELIPVASGALPGVTYDKRTYDICVTVEDDWHGVLTATTVITVSDGRVLTWINASDDPPGLPTPSIEFVNLYVKPVTPAGGWAQDPSAPWLPVGLLLVVLGAGVGAKKFTPVQRPQGRRFVV